MVTPPPEPPDVAGSRVWLPLMAIVSVIGGLFLIAGRAPAVGVLLVATGVIYLATHWTWGSDS